LNLYKIGPGPLYSFLIPYHVVHFEAPNVTKRRGLDPFLVTRVKSPPLSG
jgi:hypothetical protein